MAGIGRLDEARRLRQYRGPRLAISIRRADDHKGQLCKELAVLVRHEIPDDARTQLRQPLAHRISHARLHRTLALVKRWCAHAASPMADLAMGTKPGNASIRANHARSCG